MKFFGLRNIERYQHYRDRNPPWIKLYNSLLDDYDFASLADDLKWPVIGCMLLASRLQNKIPADPEYLKRMLGVKRLNIQQLTSTPFFMGQDASDVLAERLSRERERVETEREGETEQREPLRALVERVAEIWNSSCGPFPKIRALTDKRKKHVRARVASRNGTFEAEFRQAIEEAKASEFCRDGSWFTFDWLVSSENNWTKLLEGNYRQRSAQGETLEQMKRRLGE